VPHAYHYNNGLFEAVDAEVAHCMLRYFKPRRIVEIGGSFTTRLLAAALLENRRRSGRPGELVTIEPFPSELLVNDFPGLSMLIADHVQEVPLSLFKGLEENDILFVDSSHS
jgi:hypothetical protein